MSFTSRCISRLTVGVALSFVVVLVCRFSPGQEQPQKAKAKKADRANRKTEWVWSNPQTPAGTQHKTFKSDVLEGQEVSYLFWAPPGYDTLLRYPVAYFLHGGGGGYANIPETFLPQAEQSIKKGDVPPFIGIVVNGLAGSFYTDAKDSPVETILMKELLPHVDATYPTNGVRLIEGFSMGGRGATYLAFNYPEKFRGVVNCSGAVHDWAFFSRLTNLGVADKFGSEEKFVAAWPFTLVKRNAEKIRSRFQSGIFTAVGDADTSRGNTYEWCTKLHTAAQEAMIPSQFFVAKDVKHSYERLMSDPTVSKPHLAYYAAVFSQTCP